METTREPILLSALRSFCKAFSFLIGLVVAFFAIFVLYFLFASPYEPQEKTQLEILPNLQDELVVQPMQSPVVLQININGIIGEPLLDSQTLERILIDSRRGVLQNNRVKAILLHVNTPGGTVTDSDNIYRMLLDYKERYKTPIFAYVDGLCASGGMYVTSAADRLYASPSSIVGSVGVIFGPFFNIHETLNKVGIQSKVLTEGIDKDEMSPFRPWKPDESDTLQLVMASSYRRFVEIFTAARTRVDKTALLNEYGAKIFDAVKAQEIGYIDVADASLKSALRDLMAQANIDPAAPYQVVELQPRRDLSSLLMNSKCPLLTGKIEHTLDLGDKRSFAARDKFAYLYSPK